LSFFKTECLLREYGIVPNKKLGQNFMIDSSIFHKLGEYAALKKSDVVLDGGAGLGFLTQFLARRCKKVVAVEKDKKIAKVLGDQLRTFDNVTIIKGDLLTVLLPDFNKVISIPPYYLSSRLIPWLFLHRIDCAILILQRAFAERLLARVDSEAYGWLSVITQYNANIDLLDKVISEKFYPKPEIDSVIVRISPRVSPQFKVDRPKLFKILVKQLFANRNRKLFNSIYPFLKNNYKFSKLDTEKFLSVFSFREKRVRKLLAKDFGELINALPK
jgi:16S rRNA (adenine1518-N6/adenine1519-N6)-dimethyltransferase